MIKRNAHLEILLRRLRENPVVGLLGPRQVGKTTLAGQVAARWRGPTRRFDFEDERDLDRLAAPARALEALRGLVILDEVQRRPDIFAALRVLADRRPLPARFLILGSASPDLLKQSSESLAGRISYHELPGFSLAEVGPSAWKRLWLRGGFPRSFLAPGEAASRRWRRDLVKTYLERELPGLDFSVPAGTMRRFWTMLAHAHGQVWNSAEFARSFGVSDKTVRGYLDVLSDTYMARLLRPWHENLSKRQVKSPKAYFRDSGIFHQLSGIEGYAQLQTHPRCGASWEGFAIEQTIQLTGAWDEQCHFWATHQGAELDLLIVRGRGRVGFEFKYGRAPGLTPSMRAALKDLGLDRLWVVHAGDERYSLGARVEAVPLTGLAQALRAPGRGG
ncbi:MAG: ATP-binding protein [Elusimicrobia bacterium]|nr:ATP-binding protein [Elusimicrobiota bacterium]